MGAITVTAGDTAWFVCRAAGIVGDVNLRLLPAETTDDELARVGRMKVARAFKRMNDLHSCTKVDVEYQGVERAAIEGVAK